MYTFRNTWKDRLQADTQHPHVCTQTPRHINASTHTNTDVREYSRGHTSITDAQDALGRGVETPRVHTDCPMCPGPAGHALEGACPLLPARSSALAPGRTPAPTHSSLRGPWPEAGPGPGSGGWARGGGGCRQHRAGERKRPGDLGRLGRLGPAQGCPGPRPGMRN